MHTRILMSSFVLALLAAPAGRCAAAEQVRISEFMSSNTAAVPDEDGEFTDWIELFNAGDAAVDLGGWSLTDDAAFPRKWIFPSVTLAPGRFLAVFASGKDRRDPAYQLHTNFKLLATGEYLGLVGPDGSTVVHSFEHFSVQIDDVSYGFAQNSTVLALIGAGAASRALVPTDASFGTSWMLPDFDDEAWASGPIGTGYDRASDYLPLIGIDLRTPMDGITCSAYTRLPFTIADTAKISLLRLRMKYDDGFVAYINGQEVVRRNVLGSPVWNSCASALHDDSAALVFEEYELPVTAGLLRNGGNVLAIHGMNNTASSSDFVVYPELDAVEAGELDTSTPCYLAVPTAGWANSAGFPQVSPPPVFSHESGVYASSFSLTLSSSVPDAVIHYSNSWTEPTAASPAYTSPLAITANTMVRARVFAPNAVPGPVVTRAFTLPDATAASFTSNLPLVVVNTYGAGIPSDLPAAGFVQVFEPGDSRSALAAAPQFQSVCGIKIRGSSSANFDKKPYGLEIRDERGNDRSASILGFPSESDWVLYPPYSDKTFMRNVLAYDWSNDIGRYAVRTRFVEVFVKSGVGRLAYADYAGVYVLMEKITRDEDRIDVTKLLRSQNTPPEVTGGYMLKVDRRDPGDSGFTTTRGTLNLCYVDPKEVEITAAQRAYILGFMDDFEAALFGPSFTDPATGYAAWIDVDSWVDHFLLNELVKNIDAFRLSVFLYKDRNGKLVVEPMWDCDLALGNADYLEGFNPQGWYLDLIGDTSALWWKRLREDPEFQQKICDRWTAAARTKLSTELLLARVDGYAELLAEAQERNFARWPNVLRVDVWPNWYVGQTWNDELVWMKNWIRDRAAWISGNFLAAPVFSRGGGIVPRNFTLTISSSVGSVYYTLDGSDPRLAGGAVSSHAFLYAGPIAITQNTLVRARAKQTTRWSGLIDGSFVVDPPAVTVTEIMYHPREPGAPSLLADNEFEFIELCNKGAAPEDLSGVRFADGIEFTCPEGTVLEAGAYAVVVKNLDAFTARYGSSQALVLGQYAGSLSNGGEPIRLLGDVDNTVLDFRYDDAWYPETDGNGRSLVLANVQTAPGFFSDAETWRASTEEDGSPGAEDPSSVLPGGWQVPGDANQDGRTDISDAVAFLRLLFAGAGLTLPCDGTTLAEGGTRTLLDLNGDAAVDIADPVYLLAYLFAHGPAPALGTECVRIEGCPRVCR